MFSFDNLNPIIIGKLLLLFSISFIIFYYLFLALDYSNTTIYIRVCYHPSVNKYFKQNEMEINQDASFIHKVIKELKLIAPYDKWLDTRFIEPSIFLYYKVRNKEYNKLIGTSKGLITVPSLIKVFSPRYTKYLKQPSTKWGVVWQKISLMWL